MKTKLLFFAFLIINCQLLIVNCNAQQGEWTWMHGDSTANSPGHFGTMGVASPLNDPPSLFESVGWTDLQGNFWLFGGVKLQSVEVATLWQYNINTNMWTWIKGDSLSYGVGILGIYGTLGIPSSNNHPGARGFGSLTWVDNQNNLWLFGGKGWDAYGNEDDLADLWKYDIANNVWTWMNSPNTTNQPGSYGTKGVASSTNYPPPRDATNVSWSDVNGNLWLFGGRNGPSILNDLWKYEIATNMWTWVSGSNVPNSPGNCGSQGIPSPTNYPDARWVFSKWKDLNDNLWLFGGSDNSSIRNDLWKYDITTNMWTWMTGSNTTYSPGFYGTECLSSINNQPPARMENSACWTDACGNFWMFGGWRNSNDLFNDLWNYNVQNNEWAWISGDDFINGNGLWGTVGVSGTNNHPNQRGGSVPFQDSYGNLWLFGGTSLWPSDFRNDLWRFVPDTNCTHITSSQAPIISNNSNLITSSSANSYQWYLNDSIIPGATNQTYTIHQSGNYYVITTGYCVGGKSNVLELTYNAINQLSIANNQLSIFPNPSNSSVTIVYWLNVSDVITLEVYNVLGEKVSTIVSNEKQASGKHEYSFNPAAAGIYFVKMQTGEKVYAEKLVELR